MTDVATLCLHETPAAFAAMAERFLETREAEYALILANLELLRKERPTSADFMATAVEKGNVVAAAFYRDRNLVLTHNATMALEALIQRLMEKRIEIPGVIGPPCEAGRFSEAWSAVRGCESFLATDQALYELTRVEWPAGIPGSMRPVTHTDDVLLTAWVYAFHREALPHNPSSLESARANAASKMGRRLTYFWELDGRPVAMGSLARPTANGISVNGVYTPPEHRNHGYATALVAALSDEGLRGRGKRFCVLYTDLANPTTNSIYPKVGYRRIAHSRNYRFNYS